MGEIINEIINRYHIERKMYEKIQEIINCYLKKMEIRLKMKALPVDDFEEIAILGVIAELYPLLEDKEKWLEYVYLILGDLRSKIEREEIHNLSLIDGLSNIGLFTSILCGNSAHFAKFNNSLKNLVCNTANVLCDTYIENKKVMATDFDVIYGMSGVGNYMLRFAEEEKINQTIKKIVLYLISLSEYKIVNNEKLPGWYIKYEDEPFKKFFEQYKEGYINFSLSHGIGGPLAFLVYAYEKGIIIEGQEEAIQRIIEEYFAVTMCSKELLWTGIVAKEDYISGKSLIANPRQSWCYGSASMLFIIYRAGKLLGCSKWQEIAMEKLESAAIENINRMFLHSPIICHGYAGTAAVFRQIFEETGKMQFYEAALKLLTETMDSFNQDYEFCFRDERLEENGKKIVEDKNEFLTGAAGIIMELSAWIKKSSEYEAILILK